MGCHTWFYQKTNLKKKELTGNPLTFNSPKRGLFVEGITHDIFRVTGYPNNMFFDYPSLERWIKKNMVKRNIRITEEGWIELKQYWKDYPDSMVCFA